MSQPDGGPAFPRPFSTGTIIKDGEKVSLMNHAEEGMSLRDWFAGMALQGLLASETSEAWCTKAEIKDGKCFRTREQVLANQALKLADALLAQREAQP